MNMNKETTGRKVYAAPAILDIRMVEDEDLLMVSNYDGAETD